MHCFATDERCAEYLFELVTPMATNAPECGSTKAWSVAGETRMMICERGPQDQRDGWHGDAPNEIRPCTSGFTPRGCWRRSSRALPAVQLQRQLGICRLENGLDVCCRSYA